MTRRAAVRRSGQATATDGAVAVSGSARDVTTTTLNIYADGHQLGLPEAVYAEPPAGVSSPSPPQASDELNRAIEELAGEVGRQWQDEAWWRGVVQPVPLQVRWSSTGRPVSAARRVVLSATDSGDWRTLPLRGDVTSVASAFQDLPHGQLVVLGEPGAGKTVLAILLTLRLLELRREQPDDPVPVLLPIGPWNPEAEGADEFIRRRLVEEYPRLAGREGQHQLAKLAVQDGRVLPIFDGLDELPTDLQASAVEQLDRYAARGGPLVVTCRSQEYEQAVALGGRVLSRAAVVEIEPVDIEQAIDFLSHPDPARHRWQAIFDHLRSTRSGPLARVLSTPLMVSLARTAYRTAASAPSDLLDLPDRTSIAERLIDEYVADVYRVEQAGTLETSARGRLRNYRPEQAARWLGCLAYQLYQSGTRDLRWWQLSPGLLSARPSRARRWTPILATTALTAGAAVLAAPAGPMMALRVAGATALVVGLNAAEKFRSMYQPETESSGWVRASFGLVYGAAAAVILNGLLGFVISAFLGVAASAATAMVTAAATVWAGRGRSRRPHRSTPLSALRANHVAALLAAVQHGIMGGCAFALLAFFASGLRHALIAGVVAGAVYAAAAAFGAGLWTWTRFRLAHLQLALRGQLPLQLWAFLTDAHRRGVLRQAGTVWQFRHALLQKRLAAHTVPSHLRARAGAGDEWAARRLADLLTRQEHLTSLRTRADADDEDAAVELAALLAQEDQIEELRTRADAGDRRAAQELATQLARLGRLEELRVRADDPWAANRLIRLLVEQGQFDEAIGLLRPRADTGDTWANRLLADLLAQRGELESLRHHANSGAPWAGQDLADFLATHGHLEELQARATAGDRWAVLRLADLHRTQGRPRAAVTLLRAHALAGDEWVAQRAVDLLVELGLQEEAISLLRSDTYPHGPWSIQRLAKILAEQGEIREAISLLEDAVTAAGRRQAGPLVSLLTNLQATQVRLDRLRHRADEGDQWSARQLADVLAKQGRGEELRARAHRGDRWAGRRLVSLLADQGRESELHDRVANGDLWAARRLAGLLLHQGREEELRARAGTGDHWAGRRLTALLADQGRDRELCARAEGGDPWAARRLADLLAKRGRWEELRTRAGTGDHWAAHRLARRTTHQARIEQAINLLQPSPETSERWANSHLSDLRTERDLLLRTINLLNARAAAGDGWATRQVANLTARREKLEEALEKAPEKGAAETSPR